MLPYLVRSIPNHRLLDAPKCIEDSHHPMPSEHKDRRYSCFPAFAPALVIWGLLVGSLPGVAQAGGVERVLLLGARAGSTTATPVSRRLLDAVDVATTDQLSQIGVSVVRPSRGEGSNCEAEDFDCLTRSSRQSVDLVLDVSVLRSDEANYFLTVVLFDVRTPSETRRQQAPAAASADSRTAPREHEQSIAAKAVSMLRSLLDARQPGTKPPGPTAQDKQSYLLRVAIDGTGRVESEQPKLEIDCPGASCELKVPATSTTPVILVARPQSPSAFLGWGNAPCLPSEGSAWRCPLQMKDNLQVTARFGRTLGRKIAMPVLLIGSIASFSAAAALGVMNGQFKGPCTEPANVGRECNHNTAGQALLSAGFGVVFAVGAGLAWWLPWPSENHR